MALLIVFYVLLKKIEMAIHPLTLACCLFLFNSNTYAINSNTNDIYNLSLAELANIEVSIVTGTKQTINKAPAVVTVITSEEIKAAGATNLAEILEAAPGVHIRYNHFVNRPIIHFRGASGRQVLTMVNGKSMRDLVWTLGIFWKGLPVDMIERVEIIRGPGSALYGADAGAGVINVITKTAGTIEKSELAVRIGSFNTQAVSMQQGTNWRGYNVGMTAELSSTDGYDPLIDADFQTRLDQIFGTNIATAPDKAQYGWRNMDLRFSIAKNNWRVMADYIGHRDVEIGLTGAGVLDPITDGSDNRYNLSWLYNNQSFRENWSLDAKLRYQELNYTSGNGFQEFPIGFTDSTGTYPDGLINRWRSAERQVDFEVSTLYTGLKKNAIRIGAGYIWQDLYFVEHLVNFGTGPDGNPLPAGGPIVDLSNSSFAFAPEKSRKDTYLYIQDVLTFNSHWELTAGGRYDRYNDFGGTFNPRLALVWQATDKLTTKLIYGEAFRAPNYQELFSITSRSIGNPNLDPEQSNTLELAATYLLTQDLLLSLNIFRLEVDDIIRRDSSGIYQNGGAHTIDGFELEVEWQIHKQLRLAANYIIREPEDNLFRQVNQPEQDAYLRADLRVEHDWSWNIQANWATDRIRSSTDSRPSLDEYLLVDTSLRYAGFKKLEFAVSVKNLFDENVREHTGGAIPNDLPLPERNAYAEIRYHFN